MTEQLRSALPAASNAVAFRGHSADGSLRFEQRNGETTDGPPNSAASWAVLIDSATEGVLLDCAGWPSSRITANADRSLFLRLGNKDGETLYRIDPDARTFCDRGENGPDRPLSELAATVETLRVRTYEPPGPAYRRISPDGTVRIDLDAVEWGNSHWVYAPKVTDIASGRVVLNLWNTDWDATVSYPGDRRVSLDFRRYHFSGDLTIELDLENDRYTITREPSGLAELPFGPLSEAASAMEASGRRVAAFAARRNADRPIWDTGVAPNPWAAWRTALLILVAAAVIIAAATFLSIYFEPKPAPEPRLLRQIPRPQLSS